MAAEERQAKAQNVETIFPDLTAENSEQETTQIESLCINCGKNGITKLLLTKIPHYKDIVLMSFDCEHCGYQNNEIQSGGKIDEKGVRITLQVSTLRDLNRQVVKSDHTSIRIPQLDFEIPAQSQKGEVTTVEGIIDRSISGLEQDQPMRREQDPDAAIKIDLFLAKLRSFKLLEEPFTMIFEDISGNCHVENPNMPLTDNATTVTYFRRSKEQDHMLGIYSENIEGLLQPIKEEEFTLEQIEGEVLMFPTNCPNCNSLCETNMKMTDIPYFKEVIIMATVCEACGHRTNEVKSGRGIEPRGIRIEVKVTGREDFSRDLLKSDTCSMEIPELELEVGPSTLGGRFTTIEGIIVAIKDQLASSTAFTGDSSDPETMKRIDAFITQLIAVASGQKEVTLILDDPTGNSYIQSLSDNGLDDRLKITKYERTFEQNEELGLNDMKVTDY